MLKLAEWVKKKYKAVKSSKNQWPPRRGKNLFKLQLVDNEDEPFIREEQAELTQRGKRQVKVKRTVIEPDQIFTEAEGEKVLLEGDAGIGKSTFCSSFISDWAKDEILKQFELLLFLPLAEIQTKIDSVGSLVEFLNILFPFKQSMCVAAAEELEENGGENVLLVADGWDELGEDARRQGFLYSLLINGDILPSASILLTSRHSASAQLRDPKCPVEFEKFVEVVGFNRQNIEEYIMAEFPKDAKRATGLIEQLDNNPLIDSLCVVPLNCAIVCHLWRESDEGLPTTMTELYTKIIRSILIRNVPKTHPEFTQNIKGLSSLNNLPEELQPQWQCLCEFAFEAIEKDKVVFMYDEAAQFFPEGVSSVDEQQSCFGLLQSFESILSDSVSRGLSFHFLHLTFQEYLAADHLARQSPDKQLKVVYSHGESPRFGIVWRFFFGISSSKSLQKGTDLSSALSKKVIAAFLYKVKYINGLLLCHCSFESGSNGEVSTQVAELQLFEPGSNQGMESHTVHDCTAVVSVIFNTPSCNCMLINFSGCSLGDKGMTLLIDVLASKSGRLQVRCLDLSGNNLTDKSVSDLFNRAEVSLKSLQYLYLSQNSLGAAEIKALEDSICAGTLAHLYCLSLAETLTSDVDTNCTLLAPFIDALSTHCPQLSSLELSRNNLGVPGVLSLRKILSCQLSSLNLSETMLGDEGAYAFIQNIQVTSNFHTLTLSSNNIHSVGVSYIADSISSGMLSVTTLNLDNNPLGLDGVVAIGRMLSSSNCKLESLSVQNCQITSSSDIMTLTFTDVQQQLCQMSQNSTLKSLQVGENNFSGDNIEVLAGLMSLCQNISHLNSQKCRLTSHDLEILIHQLHTTVTSHVLHNLRGWSLNGNNISDKAVYVFLEYLPSMFPNMESIDLHDNPPFKRPEKVYVAQKFSKLSGARVVRGRDWQSGDEDGGEGHVGTVVEIVDSITQSDERRVVVQWDCGNRASYYCGENGKFELRVFNNLGERQGGNCKFCGEWCIIGHMWTCVNCDEYHLCTKCYMAGRVKERGNALSLSLRLSTICSLKHEFRCCDYDEHILSYDYQYFARYFKVPPRAGARRVEVKGIFPGAEVVRGPDWDHEEENIGDDAIGIVSVHCPRGPTRSLAFPLVDRSSRRLLDVKWTSTDKTTTHRIDQKGMVELKCVTAASGGYYYPDHLPMLGATKSVQQEYCDMIRRTQQVDDYEETSGDDQDETSTSTSGHSERKSILPFLVMDKMSCSSDDEESRTLSSAASQCSVSAASDVDPSEQDLISDLEYQAESGNKDKLSATKLWKLRDIHPKLNGEGVTIAILDTAINTKHDAFRSAMSVSAASDIDPSEQDLISDLEYQAESGNKDTLSATKLWKLRDIHPKLNGEGVTIAILDTAINTKHDAFRSAMRDGRIEILPTRCDEDKSIGNHGMMAAFIAGGESFDGVSSDGTRITISCGVAPKANLLICPTGLKNKWSAVNFALDQLIERMKNGGSLHIVSMSFGVEYDESDANQKIVEEKIQLLRMNKVICVAASGNYGNYKGGVLFPARLLDTISVGSLTVKGHQRDSNASNGIDVCAPGESIAAPEYYNQDDAHDLDNQFRFVSGSSCAAPAIAGLLALVLQHAKQKGRLKDYCDLTYIKTKLFSKDMRRGNQLEPYDYFTQNCRVDV